MQKEKTPEAEIYKPVENSQKEKVNYILRMFMTLDPSVMVNFRWTGDSEERKIRVS